MHFEAGNSCLKGVLKSVAKAFKIGTAQMEYPSGTVTVKVDAKTSQ